MSELLLEENYRVLVLSRSGIRISHQELDKAKEKLGRLIRNGTDEEFEKLAKFIAIMRKGNYGDDYDLVYKTNLERLKNDRAKLKQEKVS